MKAPFVVLALGIFAAVAVSPTDVVAQDSGQAVEKAFELSLFPPIQIRGEEEAISILRFGLYNKNRWIKGLDLGIVNHTTAGRSKAVQISFVGVNEADFSGYQVGFVNVVQGDFKGFQEGFYNDAEVGEGFQLGFVNRSADFKGFQLGFVNFAENMHGVQVGLVNIISGKESLQFLPIVNWSF